MFEDVDYKFRSTPKHVYEPQQDTLGEYEIEMREKTQCVMADDRRTYYVVIMMPLPTCLYLTLILRWDDDYPKNGYRISYKVDLSNLSSSSST
jgi:hypothetical protein